MMIQSQHIIESGLNKPAVSFRQPKLENGMYPTGDICQGSILGHRR